jgi:predicted GH43/DUF377 family glycosyl hydrolase
LRQHWEVVCAFNAGAIKVGNEYFLLLRVAERPPVDPLSDSDALLDLTEGREPAGPLRAQTLATAYVPVPLLDTSTGEPHVVVRYIDRTTPDLDVSDPRLIRYRGQTYLTSISHLRLARSTDGVHFTIDRTAAIQASDPLEAFGVEDARITPLDGTYYVNYTAVSRHGIATALASTRDFSAYQKHGVIFCPENRDVCIFPEKIDGRFAALHRPVPKEVGAPAIWYASSDNMRDWGGHRFVLGSRPGSWDERRIGGGAVPFRTERGWLEIYHGVNAAGHYALGAVLLDAQRPWIVLARSPEPILRPEHGFETRGFFGNVVFTCGCIVEGDRLRVYYGAADTSTAAADFSLKEVLESLSSD